MRDIRDKLLARLVQRAKFPERRVDILADLRGHEVAVLLDRLVQIADRHLAERRAEFRERAQNQRGQDYADQRKQQPDRHRKNAKGLTDPLQFRALQFRGRDEEQHPLHHSVFRFHIQGIVNRRGLHHVVLVGIVVGRVLAAKAPYHLRCDMIASLGEMEAVLYDAIVLIHDQNAPVVTLRNDLELRIQTVVFFVLIVEIARPGQLGRQDAASLLHLCLVGVQKTLPETVGRHQPGKAERQEPHKKEQHNEYVFEPQRRQLFRKRRMLRHRNTPFRAWPSRCSAACVTLYSTQLPAKRKAAQRPSQKSQLCSILWVNNGCSKPRERMTLCK